MSPYGAAARPGAAIGLSVVIPMYNEELVLADLVGRLRPVLDSLDTEYEVVCVDDGSSDDTAAILMALQDSWAQIRVVRLLRNSGHQAALSAGFDTARGDYVVTIDADLQDPPETIVEMLDAAHRQGVDVVYGVRRDRRSDTFFKRGTADVYYRMMRRVAGSQMPHDAGDFRLVSRRVVEAIRRLPPGGGVSCERDGRSRGRSRRRSPPRRRTPPPCSRWRRSSPT